MKLPKKAIAEFKNLYKKKFNRELTDDESKEMAKELITLYALSQGKPNIL